jgi:hypothetical protein
MRRNRIAAEVAALTKELLRPHYVYVVANLLVHDRREKVDGVARCSCCRSPDATIVETIEMVNVVIDCVTGERIYESGVSASKWAEYCALATHHVIPLRCSTKTRDLFLDTSNRAICIAGAQRAGKTSTALTLFALDVLLRGGLNRNAWLVAPTDGKAFKLLSKLLRPTTIGKSGFAPSILPPELVARTPDTHRSSNLQTVLIDGTIIDLKSFHGDPGAERLKSDPCVAILCDEAAHLPSPDSIAALTGRCMDADGRLVLASTPRPSAVMTKLVVEPALDWERLDPRDERKQTGDHPGAQWIFRSLPILENVFLNLERTLAKLKGVDMTRPENQRDWAGAWVANEGKCFVDFDPDLHIVKHEARDVAQLSAQALAEQGADDHVPITANVVKALFGKRNPHYKMMAGATNTRYVLGTDVNINPMSTVIVQVTAPASDKKDPEKWHYWVIDNIVSPVSNSLKHAEEVVSMGKATRYDPHGFASPFKGCGMIMDSTSISRDPTAHRYGGSPGAIAEIFGKVGIDVRAPVYRTSSAGETKHRNPDRTDTFALLHRLFRERRLHIFAPAGNLLDSLNTLLVMPDGICAIDARRGRIDQANGVTDGLRYVVFAIANIGRKKTTVLADGGGMLR